MHDTLIPGIKANIDQFDRFQNTYFLAGWIIADQKEIESVRVLAPGLFEETLSQLHVRRDVIEFYDLPENAKTGFKLILTPDQTIHHMMLQVKFFGESDYITFIEAGKNTENASDQTVQTQAASHSDVATDFAKTQQGLPNITISQTAPGITVVEDFYSDPNAVREYAMSLEFQANTQYHKGKRTNSKTFFPGTKERFEALLGKRITDWHEQPHNGVFQYCVAEDSLVYHFDNQDYAAVVFLTPNAPASCGTSFFKSKYNQLMREPTNADIARLGSDKSDLLYEMFEGNYYDRTRWELVDQVGNVYNRMVMWDAKKVHSASEYFGDDIHNSRLFHMFFFNAE